MRYTFISLLFICYSLHASATSSIQPEIRIFLDSFPDQMSCDGTQVNYMTGIRKKLSQKVMIEITGKDTDNPMIEVSAPSAEFSDHFKIGNGYAGKLLQSGGYSYFFDQEKNVLYYVPSVNEGDKFDFQDLLRVRDSGALISFSAGKIGLRSFRSIEITNCLPEK